MQHLSRKPNEKDRCSLSTYPKDELDFPQLDSQSAARDEQQLPLWFTDPRRNFDYDSQDSSSLVGGCKLTMRNPDNSSGSELSDCYIEDDYIPQLPRHAFKKRDVSTGYVVSLIRPGPQDEDSSRFETETTIVTPREAKNKTLNRRILMARKLRSRGWRIEKKLEIKARIRIRGLSEKDSPPFTCTCTCLCIYCVRCPERVCYPKLRNCKKVGKGTYRHSHGYEGKGGGTDLSGSGIAQIIYKLLENVADNNFKSKDIGMRAQKKLLSRMANKHIAKVFIDDTSGSLLDNLYRLVKNQTNNKKQAEKIIKNIIKIVIKIGILYRNDQFNQEELRIAENFKRKFHATAMTVTSFYEVEFSFDRNFLNQSINECSVLLKWLVSRHLTEKSIARIDFIFGFFGNPTFLEDVFRHDSQHKEVMGKIVSDIHKSMESGAL